MLVLACGIFFLGLIVGSFVNVLVLRFGFTEARRPRSACMQCGVPLTPRELIPVFSYLMLQGRCARCGAQLSWQYPAVELATGLLFVASLLTIAPLTILSSGVLAALCVFWAAFVALLTYDLRHTLVPMPFALTLIGAAAVYALLHMPSTAGAVQALAGGALLAALIGLLVLVTRGRGMGTGDIYVAGAMGIALGIGRGFEALVMSFWIGALVGIILLGLKTKVTMKSEVPFIPFLFVGTVIATFTSFSPLVWIADLIGH